MVPGGVLELDVACQQFAAERLSERDVGGVVRAKVVTEFPHPGMVWPDRVAGDPQARIISKHLLAAAIGDLLSGGEPADSGRDLDVEMVRGVQRAGGGQSLPQYLVLSRTDSASTTREQSTT